MSISNNVVSKPISLSELASLLNCKQDVGTICKSTNINMWAKYKPFVSNDKFYRQDSGSYTDRDDALKSANYGITPRYATSPAQVRTMYENGVNTAPNWGWTYLRTAVDKPMRIADFINYNHNAIRPITSINSNVDGTDIAYGENIAISTVVADVGGNNLKLSDFEVLKNGHYGLVIYNESTSSSNKYSLIQSDYKITEVLGLSFNFDAKNFVSEGGSVEKCHIYPVIVVTDEAAVNSVKYYSVPGVKALHFNVTKNAVQTLSLEAIKEHNTATNKYYLRSFTVTMSSSHAFTVDNLVIKVRSNSGSVGTANTGIGEFNIDAPSVTAVYNSSEGKYIATYSWRTGREVTETLYKGMVLYASATVDGVGKSDSYNAMESQDTTKPDIIEKGDGGLT